MSSNETTPPSTKPGAAVYRSWVVTYTYDLVVLKFSNTFAWRCPTTTTLVPFFKSHIQPDCTSHLDIGVGSGYYPAVCSLPPSTSLTLVDLNQNSLNAASARFNRPASTTCILHDITTPLPTSTRYDSISLMYLLHCMPGPPSHKARIIFAHLKHNLQPDGTLFGSTILGKGVRHNLLGKALMWYYNYTGIFGNEGDGAEGVLDALREEFEVVEGRVVGTVLLFVARGPRVGG
ncbi:MAG: hypothetical protein M1834_007447 [Cirrosporium novae-zelandiae]|nr:MAG: hypothetical protein M1834_007447 [Cirrosporium novae-zelandiae]